MHYALSHYPLSAPYRAKLEEALGATQYVNVSELRQSSLLRMIRALRALRGTHLTVATEDESSRALVPVLKMLAAVSRCAQLRIIDPERQVQSFGRIDAVKSAVRLVWTSIGSIAALALVARELQTLLRAPRVIPLPRAGQRVSYLNCNLWFGVKAGGSVGHISGVANALMDLGYALDFFTVGGRLMVDERAQFRPLAPPQMLSMPFESTYYRFHRSCVRQIAAAMSQQPPSFIYQRMSLGNHTGVVLARRFRVPLILEYNGSEVWVAKNWGRPLRFGATGEAAEQVCLRHADLVVTISEPLRKELLERGVAPERIVMYPNCIEPKMFDPARYAAAELQALRAELGFASDHIVATFIGTFGQWHGVDVLAAAIRELVERHREFLDAHRVRFLLVGDGQKMPLVRETLGAADCARYVRLTGLVPQHLAPKYLAASDILLSPHVANADGSAFFGSPTKLFEYMAMGRAIYASDLDQIGEVLRDSVRIGALPATPPEASDTRLAVLGRPGNIEDLCNGIRFLAANHGWRSALGRRARQEALEKYTWQRHVSVILQQFEVLQRASAASQT